MFGKAAAPSRSLAPSPACLRITRPSLPEASAAAAAALLKILLWHASWQQKENIFTVPILWPSEIFHFHFSWDGRRKTHRASREGTRPEGNGAAQPNSGWACLADEYRSYSAGLWDGGRLFPETPGIPSISLPQIFLGQAGLWRAIVRRRGLRERRALCRRPLGQLLKTGPARPSAA